MSYDKNEVRFEILEKLGKVCTYETGWSMELNVVKWNDDEEYIYDIRSWDPEHERLTYGLRLSKEEIDALVEAYETEFLEKGVTAEDASKDFFTRSGDDIFVDIHQMITPLSAKKDNGFTRRLCIESWCEGVPKFGIRDWSDSYERMSRGITLVDDDMKRLTEAYRTKFPKGKPSN